MPLRKSDYSLSRFSFTQSKYLKMKNNEKEDAEHWLIVVDDGEKMPYRMTVKGNVKFLRKQDGSLDIDITGDVSTEPYRDL